MKIAYICVDPGVPVFGYKGCSIHVRSVIHALLKQGHQVELFTNRLGGQPELEFASVKIHQLPSLPKGELIERETAALETNTKLRSALQQAGNFDLIYERYSLWSFAGMEYAHQADIPGILEVNAPLIEEQQQHRGLINRQAAEEVASRAFNHATVLVAVSDAVADYLATYTLDRAKIQVVPNGVDPDRFPENIQPAINYSPEEFVVGFVGTMKPWHDLQTLVEGFALFYAQEPSARLLLIGDGPAKTQIEQRVRELGCQKVVHFTGAVTYSQIPTFVASMDVAVAPYPQEVNSYFSPLKVYEYMAAGLPIIASQVGQLNKLIKYGINGLLCSPENPPMLAKKLQYLHSHPRECLRLGTTARHEVRQYHTWSAVVERLLNLAQLSDSPQKQMLKVGE